MKQKPKMILFDYGGTLLCEPDWDMLRGECALFKHVVANPHHFTPEQLCSWEKDYFQSLQPVRDQHYDGESTHSCRIIILNLSLPPAIMA